MHEWNSLHFWVYHWFIMTFITLEVGCLIMQVILKIVHKYFWGFFHVLPITLLKKTVIAFKAIMTRTKFIFPKGGQNLLVVLWNMATFSWDTFNKSHQAEQKMSTKISMDIFTNWKLIRIKYSPARLASNDYRLEDETKIKCVFFLSTLIKDDLHQIPANIKRKEERWIIEGKWFFIFIFLVLLWPGLNWSIYSFQGKKIFFLTSAEERSWQSFPAPHLPCHPCLPGEESGGFPAKWLQLFPQHQSDGVSAHVDFGWSLPLEPSSIRALALRPGALHKHSSFCVLNIHIWWILLLISPGGKSKTLESPLCPVTTMRPPTPEPVSFSLNSQKPEKIITCINDANRWKYAFF